MIDEKQLLEWERLANEATEGPWAHPGRVLVVSKSQKDEPVVADCNFHEAGQGPRNAEFIASAREAVPALIARVRELEEMYKNAAECYSKRTKEADWLALQLAERLTKSRRCPEGATACDDIHPDDCITYNDCAACWCEAAKNAVQHATH